MAPLNQHYLLLSDEERRTIDDLLVEFELSWSPDRLLGILPQFHDLPSTNRLALVTELVKIDLEHQWKSGHRLRIESYVATISEIGGPDNISPDLLLSEFEVRRQFGDTIDLTDYEERFPAQFETFARSLPEQDSSSNPVTSIPGFEILEELGAGGMGVVYKAREFALNRLVAIKMIRQAGRADSNEGQRLTREAQAVARLHHPNIVQVHQVAELDGAPYLVMEYCSGGSLADQLDGTPRTVEETVELVETIARAVHYAHQRGIVHRDLKPANILLTQSPGTVEKAFREQTTRTDSVWHGLEASRYRKAGERFAESFHRRMIATGDKEEKEDD